MGYTKEDLEKLKNENEATKEIIINNQVNKYTNIIIDHLNSSNSQMTLTMYSSNIELYQCREEIVNRLKNVFLTMNIYATYELQDQEYYNITFDWH